MITGRTIRELQRAITSEEFTELLAFRRLYTWSPDLWFSQQQLARVVALNPPDKFVPIKDPHEAERRAKRIADAEDQMDRHAGD